MFELARFSQPSLGFSLKVIYAVNMDYLNQKFNKEIVAVVLIAIRIGDICEKRRKCLNGIFSKCLKYVCSLNFIITTRCPDTFSLWGSTIAHIVDPSGIFYRLSSDAATLLLCYFNFLSHCYFVTVPTYLAAVATKLSTERNLDFISILTICLIHCNEHRAHAYDKLYMPPVPL